jgi:fucose permease
VARGLFHKPTLRLMFLQGFFGVFPWQVITYWFFRYLETERFYGPEDVLLTMAPAVLVLSSGYFVGGALGDRLFRRTPRGRLIVPTVAVLVGAILLLITLLAIPVPESAFLRQVERQAQDSWLRAYFLGHPIPPEPGWIKPAFLVMLCLTAFFIPFAAPNVVSTIYDITLPEVRSTALSVQYFIESAGAATAPLLAGLIAVRSSLQNAILLICVSAWILCAFFFIFATRLVPRDIAVLRQQMRERAEQERAAQAAF